MSPSSGLKTKPNGNQQEARSKYPEDGDGMLL
jgi:hypothetical protein